MKIGIDIRNIGKQRTGDETVFFELTRNLAKIDKQNEYRLFTDITDKRKLKAIAESLGITGKKNFRIISLPCRNKFFWNAWTLPRYLRQEPVNVFHTQYILPFFLPAGIKKITTIHDISFNYYPQFIKKSDWLFLKLLIPLSLKKADRILAVSDFTRLEIISYYKIDPQKIFTIHNAVEPEIITNQLDDQRKAYIKKKYNLPEKYILYLGTFQPRKNLPILIKAYDKIKNKHPEIKLVLAGKKGHNYDYRLEQIIQDRGLEKDIIFCGYVPRQDKAALYKLASVFVLPSLYEGFGLPILEAMSQEVPVLASDIAALRETAGNAALFFNTQSVDELSSLLHNILVDNNLRSSLSQEGKKRVGFYSWEKSARKLLSVYQSLKN